VKKLKAKFYTRINENSGVIYLRVVVPKELRVFVSKNAFWRSLSTNKVKEAQHKALVLSLVAQRIFQELSDRYVESAVVTMDIDIGVDDLDGAVESIPVQAIDAAVGPLQKTLGLHIDNSGFVKGRRKAVEHEQKVSNASKVMSDADSCEQ